MALREDFELEGSLCHTHPYRGTNEHNQPFTCCLIIWPSKMARTNDPLFTYLGPEGGGEISIKSNNNHRVFSSEKYIKWRGLFVTYL